MGFKDPSRMEILVDTGSAPRLSLRVGRMRQGWVHQNADLGMPIQAGLAA